MSIESRSRMVSFRLSEEEYDRFRELCFVNGIRSVSEMARAAINLLLQQPEQAVPMSLETRVTELEARMHMLTLKLKNLHTNSSPATLNGAAVRAIAE